MSGCTPPVAHAIRASRLIGQDLNRPFIAVDAGNVHHAMLSRVRDLPKRGKYDALTVGGVAEILVPDKQLAMFLDIRDLPSQIIDAIRKWRSWHGLRHWAGILRLLTVAGRSGKPHSGDWTTTSTRSGMKNAPDGTPCCASRSPTRCARSP